MAILTVFQGTNLNKNGFLLKMFTQIGRDIVFSVDLWYNELGDENGYRKRILSDIVKPSVVPCLN